MIRRIPRPSPALVVACLALAVALGGTSYAAVALIPPNSVGTAQLKLNAVISSKVKNGSLLKADFKAGQIPTGAAGPAGPAGAAGAAGAAGPKGDPGPGAKWALVKADGSILAQSGGISLTSHPAAGFYYLDFGSQVTDKLMTASSSFANAGLRGTVVVGPCGGPPQGAVACGGAAGDNQHVFVFTSNAANTVGADWPFYVSVIG